MQYIDGVPLFVWYSVLIYSLITIIAVVYFIIFLICIKVNTRCVECRKIILWPLQDWIWGIDYCKIHEGKCFNNYIKKHGSYWLGDEKEQEEWHKMLKKAIG